MSGAKMYSGKSHRLNFVQFQRNSVILIMSDLLLLTCLANDDELTLLILSNKAPPIPKIQLFDFESFSEQFCWLHFRFYKSDIIKLKNLLKFPAEFICQNGLKVTSTEAICILLKRMAYPHRYFKIPFQNNTLK